MTTSIRIVETCGNFAENKDASRLIRENYLAPSIKKGESVVLDVDQVDSSTQSFIHALISSVLQSYGEKALSLIQFKNCNKAIQSLVTTVVNYSLE